MAIVKYAPWAELDAVERRMRRFFGEAGVLPAPLPAADVYETDGEFVVELEVPGYEQKDLDIELTDHVLVVKGQLEETKEAKDKEFRLHERLEKSFARRFEVPPEIDVEKFDARFDKGVLQVRAPKLATAASKRIEIAKQA